MGNTISSWGGRKRVQSIINSAGLPLQIDGDGTEEDKKGPLSPFTEAYSAEGWFTGVRSQVTVPSPPAAVYKSLSKDLQMVFTPMSECHDEMEEDDGQGRQVISRIVRIPFKVAFVTGNLKLRLRVEQDRNTGKIHFESIKEGRLITRFVADFVITGNDGSEDHTVVSLDAKVNAQSLPPPPFKGMVKDVMVRKMDSCMVDLVDYHSPGSQEQRVPGGHTSSASLPRRDSQGGFLASLARSFSRRRSLEKRRSSFERQKSEEPNRGLDWRKSLDKVRSASLSFGKSGERRVEGKKKLHPDTTMNGEVSTGGQAAVFSQWQARETRVR